MSHTPLHPRQAGVGGQSVRVVRRATVPDASPDTSSDGSSSCANLSPAPQPEEASKKEEEEEEEEEGGEEGRGRGRWGTLMLTAWAWKKTFRACPLEETCRILDISEGRFRGFPLLLLLLRGTIRRRRRRTLGSSGAQLRILHARQGTCNFRCVEARPRHIDRQAILAFYT